MLEYFNKSKLNGPSGFQIKGCENHNHLKEEKVQVSKEKRFHITVIEKERCGHLEKGVDNQTHRRNSRPFNGK